MTDILTRRQFKLSDTPGLPEKIAMITGGRASAYILARNASKYADSKLEWMTKKGLAKEDVDIRTEFVQCDLGSIKDVSHRLDILINNAAPAVTPDYNLSQDGIEAVFATNHIGHFTLTSILLPIIEKTTLDHEGALIVNTSSLLHMICQDLNLSELESPTRSKSPASLDGVLALRSKLANMLFSRELSSRLQKKGIKNVYVHRPCPSNIPTDAMNSWKQLIGSVMGALIKGIFHVVRQSSANGAATVIFCRQARR
ncbi:NAD(P)-binding protein [Zopfia rhizophila CBS 207.26]|uniref:NAD(P)-binding protein n=1 Tax=Zopfia rhizophila CBS 207.26 TaxID=1314779 RepID=A0A6A6DLV2_9PEZI|nr:NAD(P)-binding protein [Zopfia rhizophila CBS 207.26]